MCYFYIPLKQFHNVYNGGGQSHNKGGGVHFGCERAIPKKLPLRERTQENAPLINHQQIKAASARLRKSRMLSNSPNNVVITHARIHSKSYINKDAQQRQTATI